MKPTIHFINNLAPHYMEPLILQLLQSEDFNFHFSCGKNENNGIQTIDFSSTTYNDYTSKVNSKLKNIWIKNRYLVWQRGVIRECLFGKKIDLMILLGEAPLFSNWIAAIICRLRGINVAYRGHGLYGNEGYSKHLLRTTFYKLANAQLVYERRSKELLVENGFKKDSIHVVFNSLNYYYQKNQRNKTQLLNKSEVYPFFNNPNLPVLIFSGRLTKSKKLDMLLKTCKAINDIDGKSVNLLIIGDGEDSEHLKKYAETNLPMGSYKFFGSCYDEEIIGKFFSQADLCISPGNVGLTAIHSLSYGTPICTHNNFGNQGPEAEAIEEGETGFYFEENNAEDLFNKTLKWITNHPSKSDQLIQNCYKIIDEYYNPHFQEKVFLNLALKKAPIV
ncbi:MAG: glycosyltransferase [Maribacter arcticus]|uniref:glycosyltransferase n=1 Tax=Maribacter arcticus TaxID=561365 RepID=UPI00300239AA